MRFSPVRRSRLFQLRMVLTDRRKNAAVSSNVMYGDSISTPLRTVPDQHDKNKNDEPQSELAGGDVADGVHAAGFRKRVQCVLSLLPVRCQMVGFWSVRAITLLTGIFVSFHLNISVPCGRNTLNVSAKPARISSGHVFLSRAPYFYFIRAFSPTLSK